MENIVENNKNQLDLFSKPMRCLCGQCREPGEEYCKDCLEGLYQLYIQEQEDVRNGVLEKW